MAIERRLRDIRQIDGDLLRGRLVGGDGQEDAQSDRMDKIGGFGVRSGLRSRRIASIEYYRM